MLKVENFTGAESELKKQIAKAFEAGNFQESHRLVNELVSADSQNTGNYFFISKYIENSNCLGDLKTVKVAFLTSFASKAVTPFCLVNLFLNYYKVKLYFCPYGQYEQDILNKESGLYNFAPDFVILFLRINDLMPDFFYLAGKMSEEELKIKEDETINKYHSLISIFNSNSGADSPVVLVHNFDYPLFSVRQASSCSYSVPGKKFIEKLNNRLRDLAINYSNVKYFDYNYFTYLFGYNNIYDENSWLMVQNPIAPANYNKLVNEYIRYFKAHYGQTYKCIAIDADNTLWGGVIGEDGFENIQIGNEYPGNIFREFQKVVLDYHSRGMLLLLLTKNNESEVLNVLRNHPGMVLREKHFSMIKANWEDKPDNLITCIRELNIGLDSVVFVDDNPAERELMKTRLPEVFTVDMPVSPEQYKETLLTAHLLEKDIIDSEDRKRGELYRSETLRKNFQTNTKSLEEYFHGLEMKVSIKRLDEYSLPRAASLAQRTNQFNLTTKRYSCNDMEGFMGDDGYVVYYLNLTDKFGDNGIVGLAIVKKERPRDAWRVDTFLLSCRIIGRTVEDMFLSYIIEQAKKDNVRHLTGEYIPTAKNIIVKDFYKKFNFIKESGSIGHDKNIDVWVGEIDGLKTFKHSWIDVSAAD